MNKKSSSPCRRSTLRLAKDETRRRDASARRLQAALPHRRREGTPSGAALRRSGQRSRKGSVQSSGHLSGHRSTDDPQTIEVRVQLDQDGPASSRCARNAIRRRIGAATRPPGKNRRRPGSRSLDRLGGMGRSAGFVRWRIGQLDWMVSSDADPDESSRARKVLEAICDHGPFGESSGKRLLDRLSAIFDTRATRATPLMSPFERRSVSFSPRRDSSISMNQATNPNAASSPIASSPCDCPTSSGAPRPIRNCSSSPKQNKLHEPKTLRQQVDRLIADPAFG